MPSYNFKSIRVVPSNKDFIDIILSKTQRQTPTVVHNGWSIQRIRAFYMRKVSYSYTQNQLWFITLHSLGWLCIVASQKSSLRPALCRTCYADILSPSLVMHSFWAIECPRQLSILPQMLELLFPNILGSPGYKGVHYTSAVLTAIFRNHISNSDHSMHELW